jgi:hypothetical protein
LLNKTRERLPEPPPQLRYPDTMQHHPIFNEIAPYVGPRPAGMLLDYCGAKFPGVWDGQSHVEEIVGNWRLPLPQFDEEYFEIVDLLESVRDARDQYVMMELGAGYGRWGVRAGLAAKRAELKDIQLVFAEAEPRHAAWLREAVAINGLEKESTIVEKAVAYDGNPVPFVVGHDTFDMGFGQCMGWEDRSEPVAGKSYYGKDVYKTPAGYHQIFVPDVTLEEMTAPLDRIDLVDMDLQRAERELVANSMASLNAQVKRVHIGTHTPEIEDEIRATFSNAGWLNVWDFGCNKTNETPYGPITFVDGVQGWINPHID